MSFDAVMEKTMRNRLKETEADESDDEIEADQEVEAAPEGEAPAPDAENEGETASERAERERDEKGRFVAKAQQDSAPPEGESGADVPEQTADTVTQAAPPVEAPASWNADDKAHFATLPPQMQAIVARRAKEMEADYSRKSGGVAQWTGLEARHGQRIARMGTTTAQLADRLLQTQELLETAPVGMKAQILLSIANDYNIPPELLAPQQATASPPNGMPQDPAMQAVAQVRNELSQFVLTQQQQAQAAAENAALQQIESFRTQKGTDGKPAHPHFDALYKEIMTLVHGARAAGQTPNLSEVYAQAVWMNPTTREATIKAERDKSALAADRAATDPAKRRAAKVNMPASNVGAHTQTGKGKTFEETMRMRLAATGYGQDD